LLIAVCSLYGTTGTAALAATVDMLQKIMMRGKITGTNFKLKVLTFS
jgi:hypothetical protein